MIYNAVKRDLPKYKKFISRVKMSLEWKNLCTIFTKYVKIKLFEYQIPPRDLKF